MSTLAEPGAGPAGRVGRVHELSLCEAIAATVTRHAGERTASCVVMRIGHLRQVVPDSLSFCWTMLTDGTDLEGCTLEIEQVPAVIRCAGCGAETTLDVPLMVCSSCSSDDVTLLSGEEFLVVSLDLSDA
jgi:hydrogenase nickel incorporation protein HypA/HybF